MPLRSVLSIRLREVQIHEILELAEGTYLDLDIEGGAGEPSFFTSKGSPSSLLARGKWVSTCLATWKTGLVPVEPGLTPTRTISKVRDYFSLSGLERARDPSRHLVNSGTSSP
jgi:hypothetical protein